MTRPIEMRPLSPAMGVEILGFDSGTRPDADTASLLRSALDEHQILLLREQSLDTDAQIALLEAFGPPLVESDDGRRFQYISNTREDGILGEGCLEFHSDHAFMEEPIDTISLYGLEVSAGCGRTHFANGLRAARALPQPLRSRVATLRARHIIDPAADASSVVCRGPRLPDTLPHALHPILWNHPRTHEPILYVNEQQTDSVESLDGAESRALLEELFAHIHSPAFAYVHEWRERDLVIWDNLALQHARDASGHDAARTLRRVSVGGTSVIEFFRMADGKIAHRNRDTGSASSARSRSMTRDA
ncbi:MAG: TauD/TfdA family dioxygenase [Deltaproteobacteria bacterium]|nr:TauD/TfdA family dioxygenase [Deltaproteobacteria bacterium]